MINQRRRARRHRHTTPTPPAGHDADTYTTDLFEAVELTAAGAPGHHTLTIGGGTAQTFAFTGPLLDATNDETYAAVRAAFADPDATTAILTTRDDTALRLSAWASAPTTSRV